MFSGPLINVAGIPADGVIPPDTNIAAGGSQLVQIVNTEFEVIDKSTGSPVQAPAAIHTIFAALGSGNLCATTDGGDPIVLYDQLAGRWVISQLSYNSSLTSNLLCVAVSKTGDATGTYNLYAFNFGSNLPDYPKLGVWPVAYYFSANMFQNGRSFSGARLCAFDRNAMLAGGQSASAVCFQGGTSVYNLLPASLDGTVVPSSGEPAFFLQFTARNGAGSTLNLYKFYADFTGASSTVTGPTGIAVATYHEACGGGTCVPQSGTSQQLDSLGDRLMYRLSYRNFGGYESLLVNHSVQVSSSSSVVGIRWYEIRNPNGTPEVHQQSTYSPSSLYRWMGSMAQDKAGNIAVGYSVSSSGMHPGIRFVGRGAGDTLNTLGAEQTIADGGGSQSGTYGSRWGDYSGMSVDPSDGCTFWYTTEYLQTSGSFNWRTQIASFKFPTCN